MQEPTRPKYGDVFSIRHYHSAMRGWRLWRARQRGTHTNLEWEVLLLVCCNKCVLCGVSGKERKLEADHIVPLHQPDSSDDIFNLQPLCADCNNSFGGNCYDFRPKYWHNKMQKVFEAITGALSGK